MDRTPGDDEALLARAVGGDAEALGALLTRHESKVRGLMAQMLGPRGHLDDLVQDTKVEQIAGMALMGLGGLISIVGGVIFLLTVYLAIRPIRDG